MPIRNEKRCTSRGGRRYQIFETAIRATPLHWLVVATTATSASFSKSRNRYALLRYSAIATTATHPIKDSEREEAAGRRDSRPSPKFVG